MKTPTVTETPLRMARVEPDTFMGPARPREGSALVERDADAEADQHGPH